MLSCLGLNHHIIAWKCLESTFRLYMFYTCIACFVNTNLKRNIKKMLQLKVTSKVKKNMHLFFLLFILCLFESVFSQEKFEAEIQIKSDSTNPIKLCSQDKTCLELIRINKTHRNNRVDTVKFSMVDINPTGI